MNGTSLASNSVSKALFYVFHSCTESGNAWVAHICLNITYIIKKICAVPLCSKCSEIKRYSIQIHLLDKPDCLQLHFKQKIKNTGSLQWAGLWPTFVLLGSECTLTIGAFYTDLLIFRFACLDDF